MNGKVLFVDDDHNALAAYRNLLSRLLGSVQCFTAPQAVKALDIITKEMPEIIVLDLCLDKINGAESGFNLFREIRKKDPSARIIVLTGFSDEQYGVRAIQLGAASFLTKPVNNEHLLALIQDGISQSRLQRACEKHRLDSLLNISEKLLGESAATARLIKEVEFAASTDQPVLITGETGSGKGYISELIHDFSSRKSAKFITFQPILHTPEMVASELFGHLKGSFTGAENARQGLISEAGRGTLFIDEVDSLPGNVQAALLGVLQNKKYRALGSDADCIADFRLISASNKDIEVALKENKIRNDLYFRMAHIRIHLTPLRERLVDIPALVKYFIRNDNLQSGRIIEEPNGEILKHLQSYDWPGNVRELQAAVVSACHRANFAGRAYLTQDDFTFKISHKNSFGFHEQINQYKYELIRQALSQNNNSQLLAARQLGIDRGTLRKIIQQASPLAGKADSF